MLDQHIDYIKKKNTNCTIILFFYQFISWGFLILFPKFNKLPVLLDLDGRSPYYQKKKGTTTLLFVNIMDGRCNA